MSVRKSSGTKRGKKSGKNYSKPRLVKELPHTELKRKVLTEAKKHKTYESFVESPALQRLAFGFESGSTLQLPFNSITLLYQDNIKDIEPLPADTLLDDTPPIRVTLKRERYILTEGYRRYVTADEMGQVPMKAIVIIGEPTEDKLTRELREDIKDLFENSKK